MIYKGWAPFIQLEQKLLDERIRVSGGPRYEHAKLDVPDFTTIASANSTAVRGGMPSFKKLLKNAGIVFEPRDGLSLFGSYAQGFTMPDAGLILRAVRRSEEHTSELQSLMRISYAVFRLKKKIKQT